MKAQMKGISLMIILLMLVLTVQAAALRGTVTERLIILPMINYMPDADSPVLTAASFNDALLSSGFETDVYKRQECYYYPTTY